MEFTNEQKMEIINAFRNKLNAEEKTKINKNRKFRKIFESSRICDYLKCEYLGSYGKVKAQIVADVTAHCAYGKSESAIKYTKAYDYKSPAFEVLIEKDTKEVCDDEGVARLGGAKVGWVTYDIAKKDALEKVQYEESRLEHYCSDIVFTKSQYEYISEPKTYKKYTLVKLDKYKIGYLVDDEFHKDFFPPMSDTKKSLIFILLGVGVVGLIILGVLKILGKI